MRRFHVLSTGCAVERRERGNEGRGMDGISMGATYSGRVVEGRRWRFGKIAAMNNLTRVQFSWVVAKRHCCDEE